MTSAFRQIRLTNTNVIVTGGGVLQVGAEQVVYRSQTGLFATTGSLNASGQYLQGLITSGQSGVGSIMGLSGIVSISGYGDVTVSTVGNTIQISGNTGAYVNFASIQNLAATGLFLQSEINVLSGLSVFTSQTGQFYAASNPNQYISSGNADAKYALASQTGSFLTSGQNQAFITSIPTGIDIYFIQFLTNFATTPKIQATIEVTGDIFYSLAIRSRTVSGYNALFSDIIQESGVSVHTIAMM